MATVTWLDKLQEQLKIDIDCMDPAEATRFLPFKPHDMTSNQGIVYKQMIAPENRDLFLKTVKEGKDEGVDVIIDRMSALLCAKNLPNLQGRVLLQCSAFHAYDTDKVVAHARSYAREFERLGVPKDRICIKIPATGPALNASPVLLEEGIRTLGTSLFSVPQAIAASQARCLSISPYFNFIWCHFDRSQWPDAADPALEHPMAPRLLQIAETYRRLRAQTGRPQPQLKPASFLSAREAAAMAELGCEHATLPENILLELSALDAQANPPPGGGGAAAANDGRPSPRLAHLLAVDPLAGPEGWDGRLAATDVDYLADNGAALEKAIAADPITVKGIKAALEFFQGQEMQMRAAVEEILKQV
ncbi:uncharacterized protein E0L32_003163 [Thyridium curvatum]|uniref:Transaldolase n=1 Tax=Thyridium curvatum TaxID=1093900 RepID=A0A507BLF7_9PEZI|nr:uncharacterized protein E0L32_003163 [Thyridium curvatum]TPX17520.1 hypothetical protein E0L32_003163 [Thyridium curvatum]